MSSDISLFTPARKRSWRQAYPVLLSCIAEGRRPSPREVETVAARMMREIGHAAPEAAGNQRIRRRVLAAARIALEGQSDRQGGFSMAMLPARGH